MRGRRLPSGDTAYLIRRSPESRFPPCTRLSATPASSDSAGALACTSGEREGPPAPPDNVEANLNLNIRRVRPPAQPLAVEVAALVSFLSGNGAQPARPSDFNVLLAGLPLHGRNSARPTKETKPLEGTGLTASTAIRCVPTAFGHWLSDGSLGLRPYTPMVVVVKGHVFAGVRLTPTVSGDEFFRPRCRPILARTMSACLFRRGPPTCGRRVARLLVPENRDARGTHRLVGVQ